MLFKQQLSNAVIKNSKSKLIQRPQREGEQEIRFNDGRRQGRKQQGKDGMAEGSGRHSNTNKFLRNCHATSHMMAPVEAVLSQLQAESFSWRVGKDRLEQAQSPSPLALSREGNKTRLWPVSSNFLRWSGINTAGGERKQTGRQQFPLCPLIHTTVCVCVCVCVHMCLYCCV